MKGNMIPAGFGDHSLFDLTFDPHVEITEYYYPEFSMTESLSRVGGILGLWLGLGILQIGGLGIQLFSRTKQFLRIK